uniref:Dirigent protein n=1 Tax=Triticum aestivum TaxID=4565 RepID=A0A3B6HTH9_WHEAT
MSPQPTLATTTTPATGPNASYFQAAPVSQETIQRTEVLLHLYAYQHAQGKPNANQTVIVDPKLPACFGALAANLVAHAQGLHIGAGMTKENWFICFNMVFVDQRFMGSSFKVMGDFRGNAGEWAIVGGTGEFAYAQGVITFNKTWSAQANVRELHVRALCLSFSKAPIELAPSEIVTEVSGTIGVFGEANVEYNAITSLTITTNVRTYGPFGEPQCTRFSVPVQDNSSIVGFFVCALKYVEALGVYVCPPVSN